jgi:hypothetical protein
MPHTKEELREKANQIKMMYRPVIDLDNGGLRIEPNFAEADKKVDEFVSLLEQREEEIKKNHYCCKYQTINPKDFCDYCLSLPSKQKEDEQA